MSEPVAGEIVLVDWRSGALPHEPTKIRPAVVVSNQELFAGAHNLLVVPLTRDERLAHAFFALRIEPSAANGATAVCWALAHHVSNVSRERTQSTPSRITSDQLRAIRQRIALALDLPG